MEYDLNLVINRCRKDDEYVHLSYLCLPKKDNERMNAKKVENEYDEQTVRDIVDWVTHAELPQEVKLGDGEYICDMKRYVEANICDIRDHYPDPFYNPSITRLIKLKEIVGQ